MELEEIELGKIQPYKGNCKIHTEEQIGKIVSSMIEFGYRDPIAVDENNVIIFGHGRLLGLRQIYSDETKVIKILRLKGLSENEKRAFRIAHNKLSLDTGFNEKTLAEEFNLLEDTDLLTSTGFSLKEITSIWEKKEESKKEPKIFKTTCPNCGHIWQT